MAPATTYPVHLAGRLDPQLGRWLWLVKWLLVIPHLFLLAFLWLAFVVLTVIVFFAILFTGRYPRSIFDFNVGVLRWTWRVAYYTYGAAGTDRYPPFTLADVPDYPATLHIDYPARLSRGLVLVKWWLLAIPHYLVVGFFVGGGNYVVGESDDWETRSGGAGLIAILVLIAVVHLLFTGRYPTSIYDFVLGLNRWVIRVAAYAGLMTDRYPPFRLDMGGEDPGILPVSPQPAGPGGAMAAGPGPSGEQAATGATPGPPHDTPVEGQAGGPAPTQRSHWTGGRIAAVVIGALLILIGVPMIPAGTAAVVFDQTQRDADGMLTTGTERLSTTSYALTSDVLEINVVGPDWATAPGRAWLGDIALQVRSEGDSPIFIGVARQQDVARYLSNVEHDVLSGLDLRPFRADYDRRPGSAPATPPTEEQFWAHSVTGTGEQTLRWELEQGRWNIVIMNADASPSVVADVRAGAEFPRLTWLGIALIITGALLLIIGVVLLFVGLRRAATAQPAGP